MMKIPFSLPVIDDDVIAEMMDTLTNTGWLTSGPKVRALEDEIMKFIGADNALCVNSWTSGAMLLLHWFGVGPGDEVIVPAYTYSATALCALNLGARPVMVDVREDFTMDPDKVAAAVTERTKAIIPVDLGGYPADYDAIIKIVLSDEVRSKFKAANSVQKDLGRVMVLADAAHSIGGRYKGRAVGLVADATVFSLHSVKNVTTGEGGAIILNFPAPFNNPELSKYLRILSLNGQNKSALEKNQPGAWRYDIIAHGLKINMPDLCASVGLAQMRRYASQFLPERKEIFNFYKAELGKYDWAVLPPDVKGDTESSYHLFLLRIKGMTEEKRDVLIRYCGEHGVGVNVHYIPMPMLTLFSNLGYDITNYPKAYEQYCNEVSLPIYNNLTPEQLRTIVDTLVDGYEFMNK